MSIEEAALCISCKKFGYACLLKIIPFRQFHIAQTKSQTSTQELLFVYLYHLASYQTYLICYISWRSTIINYNEVDCSPNYRSKWTWDKKVVNSFLRIRKHTPSTPIPSSRCQIIFIKNHFFYKGTTWKSLSSAVP
jgi:hypothetical protein